VGLDADLAQLGDRLLRGLRLELARRRQERDQRHVDEDHVLRLHLEGELAHGLEERQPLDVARRPADLGDQDVDVLAPGVDPLLDLVRHVRDHLDGLAQVHPAPLLLDHALVDLARAQAVQVGELPAREPLVMAQVEVGLRAVLEHVDLAVLVRAHRPRIDVEVRVELLYPDGQAPELKQRAERRRRQPLAKRRNHSARHEDVFHPRGLNVTAPETRKILQTGKARRPS
jgi:hypothetical protein